MCNAVSLTPGFSPVKVGESVKTVSTVFPALASRRNSSLVSQIDLLVGRGRRGRRFGFGAFGRTFALLAGGDFAFVVGAFGRRTRPCPLFQPRADFVHFPKQFFPPGDFLGKARQVLALLVGALGLLQPFIDVLAQLRAQFLGALAGRVFILGGAGFDMRAVQTDGAQRQQLEFLGQFQHHPQTRRR